MKKEEKGNFRIIFFNVNVYGILVGGFVFLESIILFLLIFSAVLPNTDIVLADVGQNNVTITSLMNIGNSFPEIMNITVNNGNNINLIPNSTKLVEVVAIIRDYNGQGDIRNVTSEFFDDSASSYGSSNDNNNHYTNNTCVIDTSYGDLTEVNATCTFLVEYYANNATWNATVFVNDSLSSSAIKSKATTINTLLALGLPNNIDYGKVNATFVSGQQEVNVTNMGNVLMNLSLMGYGATQGDGNSMNCSLGATQNISVMYEKYNLTSSNQGLMNLAAFEGNYTNLTSNIKVNNFNLNFRQNDTSNEAVNSTFWRIYVPLGVAGGCSGNIVFGAVQGIAN